MDIVRQKRAEIAIRHDGPATVVAAGGSWTSATIADVDGPTRELAAKADDGPLVIDLTGLSGMDTSGAWLVSRLQRNWEAAGGEVAIVGGEEGGRVRLLKAVGEAPVTAPPPARPQPAVIRFLTALGEGVYALRRDTIYTLNMIGAAIQGPQLKAGRRGGIRPISIFHHVDHMGLRAVPIIALMSFLIGAIIAQQGAWALRYFGAEYLTVDFVGILLLREVGVLLTAIMLAGRTGSAMTAEVGSMKMREEIDALRVIGLNPVGVLIFPRLVALVVSLPLLTFIANMAALAGAAMLLRFYSGISTDAFIIKLRAAIDLSTFFAGMIKAPFMAAIIGIMAAVEGMKVEGSAESLGRHVTDAVVKAIFLVIVVDGFFAVFYAQIDF